MTAHDIHALRLDSQPLVVLRSAVGPGLVRAFIDSGAWGVIAPRWEMADQQADAAIEELSATLARSGERRPGPGPAHTPRVGASAGHSDPSFAFYGNPLAELRLRPRAQA